MGDADQRGDKVNNKNFDTKTHRAREVLASVKNVYPDIWSRLDLWKKSSYQDYAKELISRGHVSGPIANNLLNLRDFRSHYPWCYISLHEVNIVLSSCIHKSSLFDGIFFHKGMPLDKYHHQNIVGALYSWRLGQQIIRFDHSLYQSIIETPISGNLPSDLFYRLPVWCPYIETPGMKWGEQVLAGFWFFLNRDLRDWDEIIFVLDCSKNPENALEESQAPRMATILSPIEEASTGLITRGYPIIGGTVEESINRSSQIGEADNNVTGISIDRSNYSQILKEETKRISPLISLVLYLCCNDADFGSESPKNPPIVKTKSGRRIIPVSQPHVYDVGIRIGAALRSTLKSFFKSEASGTHASPLPHLRKAHFHSYWTGPKKQQKLKLKWLSPILVNVDGLDDLTSTIRPVKEI